MHLSHPRIFTSVLLIITLTLLLSCEKNAPADEPVATTKTISAVDISSFPEIEQSQPVFYTHENQAADFLQILKNSGINTIRLRLWIKPQNGHSGFAEVKAFSERLKALHFRIWLSVHYSDTWADPGHQKIPAIWEGIGFEALNDSVQNYTQSIVEQIKPDYIQIGNEINPGFLHPFGNRHTNPQQFITLMHNAIQVVRKHSPQTQIMIHYTGISGAEKFFEELETLDYDIIGLSYYPIWHGNDLSDLEFVLKNLGEASGKELVIAETAYPFTLGWDDYTNNIVGLEEHLILPQYPASPQGQRAFIKAIRKLIVEQTANGLGFCYWGAELIAWKGEQATDASPWENQALFDFNNRELPVLEEFKIADTK
ncbi:MAG: arabinogalactan endo-1,4-beta-galactosidase [Bacteroidetes bacterium]|nr:arabinogalactan endo-1,4-beta-galactosidase [Bacteroidota bacterium]MBU1578082.1 arabinogalactan endo-1,4-beta-galactosidase [Bacteroidota bacterium]MBU2464888.1 arabinogalactan endo-1,4-beta-galactosidase [Bacteroidota bacterium]MBU2557095.1 arabinogalactan endo-1,4-beta-galactosidase [Bacteroidota bacterium]